MKIFAPALFCIFAVAVVQAQSVTNLPLSNIRLPPGFVISLFSKQNVSNPRTLAIGGSEAAPIVYASSNSAGVISALTDVNNTGNVTVCTLLRGLNNPEGLVYSNGSIFVAEVTTVTRYDNADAAARNNCRGLSSPVLIATPFPRTTDHNARHMELGPDDKLYLSYGSPGNVDTCEKYGNINACSIVRINQDGTELENYAVGVRNSIGFAWHPDTEDFFFNEIERDLIGDNRPDDVLYLGRETGSNYTWEGLGDPYLRSPGPGQAFADPDASNAAQKQILAQNAGSSSLNASLNAYCNESAYAPQQAYGPHVTAASLKFYTGSMFPQYYDRTLFIPQRGSWNRPLQIGYRVMNLKLDSSNNVVNYTVFAEGWLQNQNTTQQSVWGRPVGAAQLPDGSLLISDDTANAIYRISYEQLNATSPAPAVSSVTG